ncbi:MAG: T9SS type A sorting domain-containing protein, partial [Bacteroidia bacterium]|nr:T9SS type A sorting domain-containing protein [Bacteroidia bacterium]
CSTAIVTNDNVGSIGCGEIKTIQFILTDACGNENIVSASFNVEDTLGISGENDTSLLIYPNPSYDHIIISGLVSQAKIEIYDLSGQRVLRETVLNDQHIPLDLSAGLYLVKVFENSKITIKKLVVR